MEKNLIGRRSQAYETIWIFNLWENHANLINFDLKHFLSQSFQGHNLNPWVTLALCMLLALSYFPFKEFFLNFPKIKGINCAPKLKKKKNVGHRAHLELKTIVPQSLGSPWIDKQSFPSLHDFYVQHRMCTAKLRNHVNMTS